MEVIANPIGNRFRFRAAVLKGVAMRQVTPITWVTSGCDLQHFLRGRST
jgi:hypothetical protein